MHYQIWKINKRNYNFRVFLNQFSFTMARKEMSLREKLKNNHFRVPSFWHSFKPTMHTSALSTMRSPKKKKKNDDTSLISCVPALLKIFGGGFHCNRLRLQTVAPTIWRARLENSFTASRARWKCPSNHKRYITHGDNRCHRASLSIPISLLRAQTWRLVRRTWKLHWKKCRFSAVRRNRMHGNVRLRRNAVATSDDLIALSLRSSILRSCFWSRRAESRTGQKWNTMLISSGYCIQIAFYTRNNGEIYRQKFKIPKLHAAWSNFKIFNIFFYAVFSE